jgi:hypothetical protein
MQAAQTAVADQDERRTRLVVVLAAILCGVLASGVMVLTASRALFSDTTENTGSALTVGSVDLIDDDSGTAAFTVTAMAPGDSVTRCILVTYQGTIADPGAVVMYSGGFTDSGTLAAALTLTIEEGDGGSFSSCASFASPTQIYSGTLAAFDAAHDSYANGIGSFDPSSTPASRGYRITVTLPSNAANSLQGASVTNLAFTWEVQS